MPKRKIIDEEQQVIADQPVSSSSPVSKKAKSSPQKAQNSIMFEDKNLLDVKGTTLIRYARNVARVLWSDPDSLWERRIVDIWDKKTKNVTARPPFRGPKNMMKIQLLMDAVRTKWNVPTRDWLETWEQVKTSVNEIGQRRKFYKGTKPKRQYSWVIVGAKQKM